MDIAEPLGVTVLLRTDRPLLAAWAEGRLPYRELS
jgi:hypothetical protein